MSPSSAATTGGRGRARCAGLSRARGTRASPSRAATAGSGRAAASADSKHTRLAGPGGAVNAMDDGRCIDATERAAHDHQRDECHTVCYAHTTHTQYTHTQLTIHRTVDPRLRLRLSDRLTRMRFCSASAANALRAFVSSSCSGRQPPVCAAASTARVRRQRRPSTAAPPFLVYGRSARALCLHRAVGTPVGARLAWHCAA